jgi:hypothetical protein
MEIDDIDEIDYDEILETILKDIMRTQGALKVVKHYMKGAKKKGDTTLGFLYFKEIKDLERKLNELNDQYRLFLKEYIKETNELLTKL